MINTKMLAAALLVSSFALVAALDHSVNNVRKNATIGLVDGIAFAPNRVCDDSDTSGGMGGQEVSCDFVCSHPGTISVSLKAGDEDAYVAGKALCNEQQQVSCSGKHKCDQQSTTDLAGAGKCHGESSETWDSGLTVSCYSDPIDNQKVTTSTSPPVQRCPVTVEPSPPYPRICFDSEAQTLRTGAMRLLPFDTCQVLDLRSGAPVCGQTDFARDRLWRVNNATLEDFVGRNGGRSKHIFVDAQLALGLSCLGFDCIQVDVTLDAGSAPGRQAVRA